jgi:hypothetical protein
MEEWLVGVISEKRRMSLELDDPNEEMTTTSQVWLTGVFKIPFKNHLILQINIYFFFLIIEFIDST